MKSVLTAAALSVFALPTAATPLLPEPKLQMPGVFLAQTIEIAELKQQIQTCRKRVGSLSGFIKDNAAEMGVDMGDPLITVGMARFLRLQAQWSEAETKFRKQKDRADGDLARSEELLKLTKAMENAKESVYQAILAAHKKHATTEHKRLGKTGPVEVKDGGFPLELINASILRRDEVEKLTAKERKLAKLLENEKQEAAEQESKEQKKD